MDTVVSEDEVRRWLLETIKHSCHVEYYINRLGLESEDPERPHDIIGIGNKLAWPVISGLALQYRNDPTLKPLIHDSRDIHRQQYHHRMWNQKNPDAAYVDLQFGAVDTICCLLENRSYTGGSHSFDQIRQLAATKQCHQREPLLEMIDAIERITPPQLDAIATHTDIPNIGLPRPIHRAVQLRVETATEMLRDDHGYAIVGPNMPRL